MSELTKRAREIYNGLPIADLKAAGIWPSQDYELVYNNPPYKALDPIQPETIYSSDKMLNIPRKIALYVHFPFCESICAYCHYAKRTGYSPLDISTYLVNLAEEVMMLETTAELRGARIQSLHLGGGTPSLWSPKFIDFLRLDFRFEPGIEMTTEGNPASITREWLEESLEVGFNRINIGVQSFEDHLLKICARPHDSKQARKAIELARETGFGNINVDLIFGLPGQCFEDWQRSLQTLIKLQPASVTCYRLRRNPQTRFGRMPNSDFPSPEDQLLMHIMAIESLCDAGYIPWHFENLFVRDPKYTHQHQEHKWQDGELLGIGLSSYSHINGCVYHNTYSLEEYQQHLQSGHLPIDIGRVINQTEQMHRWMMFGLMKLRLEQEPFRARFGIKPSEVFKHHLDSLQRLGIVEIDEQAIRLTKYPGLLFPMEILSRFYTEADKAKLAAKGLRYGSYPR